PVERARRGRPRPVRAKPRRRSFGKGRPPSSDVETRETPGRGQARAVRVNVPAGGRVQAFPEWTSPEVADDVVSRAGSSVGAGRHAGPAGHGGAADVGRSGGAGADRRSAGAPSPESPRLRR